MYITNKESQFEKTSILIKKYRFFLFFFFGIVLGILVYNYISAHNESVLKHRVKQIIKNKTSIVCHKLNNEIIPYQNYKLISIGESFYVQYFYDKSKEPIEIELSNCEIYTVHKEADMDALKITRNKYTMDMNEKNLEIENLKDSLKHFEKIVETLEQKNIDLKLSLKTKNAVKIMDNKRKHYTHNENRQGCYGPVQDNPALYDLWLNNSCEEFLKKVMYEKK